jgi:serine/threonine-protein kinase RsbW
VHELGHKHGLGAELIYRIAFCAEELVTNVIVHGHEPTAHGSIWVRLDVADGGATLTVEDHGQPFDPTTFPPPAKARSLEEAPVGGLGLHMVRQSSSGMQYRRLDGMNRLVVLFRPELVQEGPED